MKKMYLVVNKYGVANLFNYCPYNIRNRLLGVKISQGTLSIFKIEGANIQKMIVKANRDNPDWIWKEEWIDVELIQKE